MIFYLLCIVVGWWVDVYS